MISIIGAGPAGCYAAYKLAARYDVDVFEEHGKIGLPVQCTGITTSLLDRYVKGDFIVNKIKNFEIISPNNKSVTLPTKEYVIDRTKFDQHIADMAVDAGTKIHLNSSFVGKEKDNKIIIKNKNKIIKKEYNHLIGADGPLSSVSKAFGMQKNAFIFGMQARAYYKSEGDTVKVILNNNVAPGFFAWIVPEDEKIARIGLAARHNTKAHFQNFLKKVNHKKILDTQAGLIPIFQKNKTIQKNNVYLIGDAAAQVKATTGGGIIQGFQGAENAAMAIIKKQPYAKLCSHLHKELFLHKVIRAFLDNFSNKDYNSLIEKCNDDKVKHILKTVPRDMPFELMFKLGLTKPSFLKFIKNIIPKSL